MMFTLRFAMRRRPSRNTESAKITHTKTVVPTHLIMDVG